MPIRSVIMLAMSYSATRREFLALTAASLLPVHADSGSRQASGVKVGEITPDSVLIWTRRTKSSARKADGTRSEEHVTVPLETDPATLEGACPGADGEMRVIVTKADGKAVHTTEWA